MKKISCFILVFLVVFGSLFCISYADGNTEVSVEDYDYYQKFRGQNVTINVFNWGEYISDGSEDSLDVNKAFEELTGIKVNYSTFASNEELYAKLRSGGVSYDIIIPSDYMVSRMIKEGMLQKLNFENIPNYQYIDEKYKGLEYDPDNEYSVPYTWGLLGIIYDSTVLDADEVTSWSILWDERFFGDIIMIDNSRDAFGIALKLLGYSFNTENEEELEKAAEKLKEQKPLLQAYYMDQIFDKMESGEALIAPYYAGDAIVMMEENPDLAWAVPEEGTNLFVDSMCIPTGAKNKEAAEMYINFMCETEVAVATAEYIGYATPHTGAFEELDEEITSDEVVYPADEIIENTEVYLSLSAETNLLIDDLWTQVRTDTGGNRWIIPGFLVAAIGGSISINVYRKVKKSKKVY